jgi:glutamine amidotransferase
LAGVGVLSGRWRRLDDRGGSIKIPQVGWKALELTRPSRLLEGVSAHSYVYFTHSYAAPVTDATVAAATHGDRFAAAVERGLVMGVQFHPEKSSSTGLQVVRNFVALCAEPVP